VREIQAHLEQLDQVEVSPSVISAVTAEVMEEETAWQQRPLDRIDPVVIFDLRIGQTEGADFFLRVMTELKSRGVEDILIALVDGLVGFPDAITTVFPQAQVHDGAVHLVRQRLNLGAGRSGRRSRRRGTHAGGPSCRISPCSSAVASRITPDHRPASDTGIRRGPVPPSRRGTNGRLGGTTIISARHVSGGDAVRCDMTLLLRAIALTAVAFPLTAQDGRADLCITDATVISPAPVPAETRPRTATVCVRDGRILSVEPQRPAMAARETIDGRGRFLIPGLIDSHVHLYHAPGLDRRYTARHAELMGAYQTQLPRSFLAYGFTSVVELNSVSSANRRFESAPLHPDLFHCGQGLVLSNDFMATDFDDPSEFLAAFPNFLHDRFTTPELPPGFDPAAHTPAATVGRIAEEGGRCVKLYHEEALWWPGPERPDFRLPSLEIVREVVAEAHRRGLPVVMHATTPAGQRLALAGGVDVLAHGLWEWPGSFRAGGEVPSDVTALTDSLASSTVCIQPTAMTLLGTATLFDPEFLEQGGLREVLSSNYLDYLRTEAQVQRALFLGRFGSQISATPMSVDALAVEATRILAHVNARFAREVARWAASGACLLLGSDTAVGGFGWSQPPGLAGFLEMQTWARNGIPLAQILHAATRGNARAFRLADELGSIETGKRANLLLLRDDPLRSIEAYRGIDLVILGGRVLERATLLAP
jgi:imidazolonepropionase-like amidohydrolase